MDGMRTGDRGTRYICAFFCGMCGAAMLDAATMEQGYKVCAMEHGTCV